MSFNEQMVKAEATRAKRRSRNLQLADKLKTAGTESEINAVSGLNKNPWPQVRYEQFKYFTSGYTAKRNKRIQREGKA